VPTEGTVVGVGVEDGGMETTLEDEEMGMLVGGVEDGGMETTLEDEETGMLVGEEITL
jgi:hypothetical protein